MIEMVAAKMAALQVNSRAEDPLGWAKAQRTRHRAVTLIGFARVRENQFQRLARVNALVELLLQYVFGLRGQIVLGRFFAGQLRQDRQFVLNIACGNAVPKAIFKGEHIHALLLYAEQLSVRKLHHNFIRTDIDRQVLPQIESGFDRKRAVKFYAL